MIIVDCQFYMRQRATGDTPGFTYTPVRERSPSATGSVPFTVAPAVGDIVCLSTGTGRVVARQWQPPAHGSIAWPTSQTLPIAPVSMTVILEPAEGVFEDEVDEEPPPNDPRRRPTREYAAPMTTTAPSTLPSDPTDHPDPSAVDFIRDHTANEYALVVGGVIVPNVTARRFTGNAEYATDHSDPTRVEGEYVAFHVSSHEYDIPASEATTVARLLARAVAVNLGWAKHPTITQITTGGYRGPYRVAHGGDSMFDAECRPYHNGLRDLPDCGSPRA